VGLGGVRDARRVGSSGTGFQPDIYFQEDDDDRKVVRTIRFNLTVSNLRPFFAARRTFTPYLPSAQARSRPPRHITYSQDPPVLARF